MKNLNESGRFPHNSTTKYLSPAVDNHGILPVGGRLNKIENNVISMQERNPIILRKESHVTCLIIGYFHSSGTPFHGGRCAFSRLLGGWIEEDSVIVNQQMCDVPEVAWENQPSKDSGSFR